MRTYLTRRPSFAVEGTHARHGINGLLLSTDVVGKVESHLMTLLWRDVAAASLRCNKHPSSGVIDSCSHVGVCRYHLVLARSWTGSLSSIEEGKRLSMGVIMATNTDPCSSVRTRIRKKTLWVLPSKLAKCL